MKWFSMIVCAAIAVGTTAPVEFATAAPVYVNDYSSAGLPNENPDAAWTHNAGNGTFDFLLDPASGNVTSTSSAEVTGLGTSDFVVSTRFTLSVEAHTGAGVTSTVGFGAFGTSSGFGTNYLADWFVNPEASNAGTLRILAQGDGSDFNGVQGDADGVNGDSIVVGNTYELRLSGSYAGGALNMTLALYDDAGNQLGTAATATDLTPLTGTYFGYRNRVVSTHSVGVDYDDFRVVAIPEPTSLALVALAVAGLAVATRRRTLS